MTSVRILAYMYLYTYFIFIPCPYLILEPTRFLVKEDRGYFTVDEVIGAVKPTLRPGKCSVELFISLYLYSPLDLERFFSFLILYTVSRSPRTGDQPVARPLHTHKTTETE
jgi:phosphatidylglycerophosphatase A